MRANPILSRTTIMPAILATAALLMPSHAWAAAYCRGYTTHAFTEADGDVLIRSTWRDDWATICNLDQTQQGISSSTCFGWLSSVSNSITDNGKVVLRYSNLDQSACATMANQIHGEHTELLATVRIPIASKLKRRVYGH